MDANGLMSGDRGYDPNTEQGSSSSDGGDNPFLDSMMSGKGKKKDQEVIYPHPEPITMPDIDFSHAPAWWNKGGQSEQPPLVGAPDTGLPEAPPQSPIMLDILGNLNGSTGIVGQTPMSNALRNGGQ